MAKSLRVAVLALVLAYLYVPIGILIVNAFNQHRFGLEWKGFTFKWFEALWHNTGLMTAAGNSLIIALLAATFAALIGTLAAVALFRYQFKGKGLLSTLLFVVMMSPDIVMAVSFLALFVALGIGQGFWPLLFAHITFCLPFVVVTVYSRLKGFDVRMLEAARDLGAGEFVVFRKILMPLAKPAIAGGWLLSFTLSLDDVIISSFVTGPSFDVLPIKIFSMVKVGVKPEVNALAVIMLGASLVLVLLSQWLMREKK
ncbi:spermidine/putrescine ABC transporter permease PotC [Gallaecimonas xiamenensis]|uniref:Spermidine/putrescine transport system permease protein PotC n=1 Tax=Gallaecimonas xiamenensis 3-C-1 TaxID=745411 RepID=K2J1F8_9GAMM|nr:spermidine/putrescine ABC transporter permease PotC [Gallaecimonas xiamenensis]EKE76786.1 spermidine/putrescine ABC transporter membrane protein [Gallaecimonas xiamenensis 3-C-1]